MKNRKPIFLLVLLAIFLVVGCDEEEKKETEQALNLSLCVLDIPGDVYIAEIIPMQIIGDRYHPSVQLAVTEINAGGGINGSTLGLITCDSENNPERAGNMLREVAATGLVGSIIGPSFSGEVIETMPIIKQLQIPCVSPTATMPPLSTADDGGYFFRTDVSDALLTTVFGGMIAANQYTSVAVVAPNDAWGTSIAEGMMTNINTEKTQVLFDTTSADFVANTISAISASNADAVVLVAYPTDEEAIIKAAQIETSIDVTWLLPNQHTDIIEAFGPYLDGAKGTLKKSMAGDPSFENYIASYTAAWGAAPESTQPTTTYDAVYLSAIAMVLSSDPTNGPMVMASLAKTSTGNVVRATEWSKILTEAAAGQMNYEGASGPVDFDANGDVAADFQEWTFTGGEFVNGDCWSASGTQIPCN